CPLTVAGVVQHGPGDHPRKRPGPVAVRRLRPDRTRLLGAVHGHRAVRRPVALRGPRPGLSQRVVGTRRVPLLFRTARGARLLLWTATCLIYRPRGWRNPSSPPVSAGQPASSFARLSSDIPGPFAGVPLSAPGRVAFHPFATRAPWTPTR